MAAGNPNAMTGQPALVKRLGWTFNIVLLSNRGTCSNSRSGCRRPGIFFESMQGTLFSLLTCFRWRIVECFCFALGVMPYISASIIMQLLQVASPDIKRMSREEGQAGRRKIINIHVIFTVAITLVQGTGHCRWP